MDTYTINQLIDAFNQITHEDKAALIIIGKDTNELHNITPELAEIIIKGLKQIKEAEKPRKQKTKIPNQFR